MTDIIEGPVTLVRVGSYAFPLQPAIVKFQYHLSPLRTIPQAGVERFSRMNYRNPSFLLYVYRHLPLEGAHHPNKVKVIVTSFYDKTNRQLAEQFASETGIALELHVPRELEIAACQFNTTFRDFLDGRQEFFRRLASEVAS